MGIPLSFFEDLTWHSQVIYGTALSLMKNEADVEDLAHQAAHGDRRSAGDADQLGANPCPACE